MWIPGWSPPQPNGAIGPSKGAIARFATIASSKHATFVVGNDMQGLSPEEPFRNPFAGWELGGSVISAPAGRYTFAFPRAATDSLGRLVLVWAEPESSAYPKDVFSWMNLRFVGLWSATREVKSGWSTPNRFYVGRIHLNKFSADQLVTTSTGQLHLVAPTLAATGPSLVHAFFDGRTWVAKHIEEISHRVSYSGLAEAQATLFVAFIGTSVDAAGRDMNSVFLTRSDDSGATWSIPSLIHRSNNQPAYDLRIHADRQARLHLVWYQRLGGGDVVLRHVFSTDGGRTYLPVLDIVRSRGVIADVQIASDPCGNLHVAYSVASEGLTQSSVAYAVWDGGWSVPRQLLPSLDTTDPSLGISSDGRPILVFLARRSGTTTDPFVSMYSVLNFKT